MTKKIVVTGIGASSPVGGTAPESWTGLLAGESGAHSLTQEWVAELELPVTFAAEATVRPEEVLERIETKRLDPSSQFALISAREAWADAGSPEVAPERLGVDWATGIGGLWTLLDAWDTLREKGPRRVLPMTVPMLMPNAAAAAVSMSLDARAFARTDRLRVRVEHRVDRQRLRPPAGRATPTSSSRAARSRASTASRWPRSRRCRRSASATTTRRPPRAPTTSRATASSWAREPPRSCSRPKSTRWPAAPSIYAEIAGGGVTSDSYHITAPDPEGSGRRSRGSRRARAGRCRPWTRSRTSTRTRPARRSATSPSTRRCVAVFGDRVHDIPVSATKAATGHLLGGTGALEAVFTILAVKNRTAPPTINLTEQDPEIPLSVVGRRPARSGMARSSRSGTRSASAATTR